MFWLVAGRSRLMADNGVVAGGRLTDWVSLGVLAAFVPRDAVDDAVAAAGKQARRSDGKLPLHVMVYFVMALALPAMSGSSSMRSPTGTVTGRGRGGRDRPVPRDGRVLPGRGRRAGPGAGHRGHRD